MGWGGGARPLRFLKSTNDREHDVVAAWQVRGRVRRNNYTIFLGTLRTAKYYRKSHAEKTVVSNLLVYFSGRLRFTDYWTTF